uniref:Uncharacterized protein n=1 Tax=Rhipicephalus zambeziensis TaxID=60191 RepID=A0A224Y8Y9_9ACAR
MVMVMYRAHGCSRKRKFALPREKQTKKPTVGSGHRPSFSSSTFVADKCKSFIPFAASERVADQTGRWFAANLHTRFGSVGVNATGNNTYHDSVITQAYDVKIRL